MTTFDVGDDELAALNGQVLLVSGGSSGIGLATVELFVSLGAKVVVGDMNPIPESSKASGAVEFIPTDVTIWKDLRNLFSQAKARYGVIDMVFANAGIPPRTNYFDDEFDENGDLLEPPWAVMDVNLRGCINTVRLAVHYMRQQEKGGSIVATASAASYQRFAGGDYTVSKHGVLGLVRSLYHPLRTLPIRLNAIAPSWTETGMCPAESAAKAGFSDILQSPAAVARSVASLMVDQSRHGQLIYSEVGKYAEIETDLIGAGVSGMATVGHTVNDEDLRAKLVQAMV